jgi:hypothetical protein
MISAILSTECFCENHSFLTHDISHLTPHTSHLTSHFTRGIAGQSPDSIEVVFLAASIHVTVEPSHVTRDASHANVVFEFLIWVEGEGGPVAPDWTEHCFSEVRCEMLRC